MADKLTSQSSQPFVSIIRPSARGMRNSPVSSLMLTRQVMRLLMCLIVPTLAWLMFLNDMVAAGTKVLKIAGLRDTDRRALVRPLYVACDVRCSEASGPRGATHVGAWFRRAGVGRGSPTRPRTPHLPPHTS
ncbi:hypothetical protein OH76DRAFT_1121909 [Lentinus brumalis]|uniref:Uncharacterized protein n=1 Tax=Lentinus brumalis TaxID=2498619 RepID=A0A371CUP4_9APHY|nr:hypothetical protein OH76DRAFT_1121909 [Polyporus brumalis]